MNGRNLTELINMMAGNGNGAGSGGNIAYKRLPQKPAAPAIPARTGASGPVPKKNGGGGGVASPLMETAFSNRTWHPETTISSTDGLFAIKVKRIKSVSFTDANGDAVSMEFKAPT